MFNNQEFETAIEYIRSYTEERIEELSALERENIIELCPQLAETSDISTEEFMEELAEECYRFILAEIENLNSYEELNAISDDFTVLMELDLDQDKIDEIVLAIERREKHVIAERSQAIIRMDLSQLVQYLNSTASDYDELRVLARQLQTNFYLAMVIDNTTATLNEPRNSIVAKYNYLSMELVGTVNRIIEAANNNWNEYYIVNLLRCYDYLSIEAVNLCCSYLAELPYVASRIPRSSPDGSLPALPSLAHNLIFQLRDIADYSYLFKVQYYIANLLWLSINFNTGQMKSMDSKQLTNNIAVIFNSFKQVDDLIAVKIRNLTALKLNMLGTAYNPAQYDPTLNQGCLDYLKYARQYLADLCFFAMLELSKYDYKDENAEYLEWQFSCMQDLFLQQSGIILQESSRILSDMARRLIDSSNTIQLQRLINFCNEHIKIVSSYRHNDLVVPMQKYEKESRQESKQEESEQKQEPKQEMARICQPEEMQERALIDRKILLYCYQQEDKKGKLINGQNKADVDLKVRYYQKLIKLAAARLDLLMQPKSAPNFYLS